jgi:hypothetical protein
MNLHGPRYLHFKILKNPLVNNRDLCIDGSSVAVEKKISLPFLEKLLQKNSFAQFFCSILGDIFATF